MKQKTGLDSEFELMIQVAEGSESATRKLTADYLDYVISLAYRITGNRHDAEEIAQEVFLKLFKQAENWRPQARISTWLYRVTYNAAIDLLRFYKRRGTYELKDFSISHKMPEEDFLPEEVEVLEVAMNQLPVKHRSALAIFYFQEKKIREAAEIMSLKEDAFESLLRRACKKLRNILEEMDICGEKEELPNEPKTIFQKSGDNASQVPLLYQSKTV